MVKAYILVQTEVAKASSVAAAIAQIPGVVSAEEMMGSYDVMVQVQADSVDELGPLVMSQVQTVPGIVRTVTCTVVHN